MFRHCALSSYGRFPQFQSSNFQFESLKSEQINCGCFFDTMSDFKVPGARPKKTMKFRKSTVTNEIGTPDPSWSCSFLGFSGFLGCRSLVLRVVKWCMLKKPLYYPFISRSSQMFKTRFQICLFTLTS